MKKNYEKPNMDLEMFEANEYIAACYDIACNVPSGRGYWESNGVDGLQTTGRNPDSKIGSGYGCGKVHKGTSIDSPAPYHNAWWIEEGKSVGDAYKIFAWKEGWWNAHFSKVEDANWAPNPNAS